MCKENACDVLSCSYRHPLKCKYHIQYQRCKFGEYCRYLYISDKNQEEDIMKSEIEAIKEENKTLKEKVRSL